VPDRQDRLGVYGVVTMGAGSFVGTARGELPLRRIPEAGEPTADTNRGVAKGQRLPHEELVPQDPVGRVEDRQGGAAGGVGVGQEAAHDPLPAAFAP